MANIAEDVNPVSITPQTSQLYYADYPCASIEGTNGRCIYALSPTLLEDLGNATYMAVALTSTNNARIG